MGAMTEWMKMILAAPAGDGSPSAPTTQFIWLILLIGMAFYFIIFRPQRREQAQKDKMLSAVEKGDRVVTIGGIHGTVAGVDTTNKTVSINVGKGVMIEFSRNAVASVEKKGKKAAEEAPKEKEA
jgi:preprotein translocase subunit YajC